MASRFDPTNMLEFNLARGQINLSDAGDRLVLPADLVLDLCRSAGGEAQRDFGRRVGTELGGRAASRLSIGAATIDDVVEHFGGDLALIGLGSLGAERWGQALVLTVAHSPLGTQGDTLLGAVLEGAIQRGLGREVTAVLLNRDDALVRFLIVSERAAVQVRGWLDDGIGWGDAIGRLNTAGRGEA